MKKVFYGAVIAGAMALPLCSHAAGYVDLGVGQSTYHSGNYGFSSVSGDDHPTAYSVAGGIEFTPMFGAELGYADLGDSDRVYTTGGTRVSTSLRTRTIYLAGTATAPISDQFSIFGKLGVAANRTKGTANLATLTANDTENRTGWMAGVGAAYHFTPNLAGTVGYDYFDKIAEGDSNAHADMWKIGVRLRY